MARTSTVKTPSFRRLLGLGLTLAALLSGCDSPCRTLADRLCESAGDDDAACERWRERVARVPKATCEAGLRALDRDRLR